MQWLLESAENFTELPEAFLSAAELEKFSSFRFQNGARDGCSGGGRQNVCCRRCCWTQTNEMRRPQCHRNFQLMPTACRTPNCTVEPLGLDSLYQPFQPYALCACHSLFVQEGEEVRSARIWN